MIPAPFTLIERDALNRVRRVTPLMFVPANAIPKRTKARVRQGLSQ